MFDIVALTGKHRMLPCFRHSRQVVGMGRLRPTIAESLVADKAGQLEPAIAEIENVTFGIGNPGNLRAQLYRPAKFFLTGLQGFGGLLQRIGCQFFLGYVAEKNDDAIP